MTLSVETSKKKKLYIYFYTHIKSDNDQWRCMIHIYRTVCEVACYAHQ